MTLKNKVVVIYGAGAVGQAVARAFAREGARLHLTDRHLAPAQAIAKELPSAQAAQVDALDEQAIDAHLAKVVADAGRIDVSFNAVGLRNTTLQGVPLVELDVDQFLAPITTYARSYFLTARVAGRRMVAQKSGVIMTVTSVPARTGIPLMGGVGPAMGAVEALTRNLSAEFAPHGVRVVGLRPQGMPDSGTIKEVFGLHAKAYGITPDQFHEQIASRSHTKRLTTLAEMANVAAFVASDAASAMTGTIVNMSLGSLDD